MAVVLNRTDTSTVVERTDVLVDAPYNVGLLEALGLFTDQYVSQKRIEIVRTSYGNHLVQDRNWDEREGTLEGAERQFLQLKIPHFPTADAIYPQDIDGEVVPSNSLEAMELESVARLRAEKMEIHRSAHALTLEAARYQILRDGSVYAPRGTMRTSYGATVNFYNEWGVTRPTQEFDFSAANDPRPAANALIKKLQDALRNTGGARGYVVLCSEGFWTALISNGFINEAQKYDQTGRLKELMVGEMTDNAPFNLDARFQSLKLWGLHFINVSAAGYDDASGTFVPFVPADQAIAVPVGVRGMFKTYYAPANKFGAINKKSKGSYWYEYANIEDDEIKIKVEQNFLNAVLYPEAVITCTLA